MSDVINNPVKIDMPIIEASLLLCKILGRSVHKVDHQGRELSILKLVDGRQIALRAATIGGRSQTYLYF